MSSVELEERQGEVEVETVPTRGRAGEDDDTDEGEDDDQWPEEEDDFKEEERRGAAWIKDSPVATCQETDYVVINRPVKK